MLLASESTLTMKSYNPGGGGCLCLTSLNSQNLSLVFSRTHFKFKGLLCLSLDFLALNWKSIASRSDPALELCVPLSKQEVPT